MAYSSNIPQASDSPSQSQPLILANFQEIATAFNLNHGDFNDAGNQGKHEFLQMPEQGAAPVTAAGEGALYTKDSGTQPELFWRDESNGTEWQVTNQATQTTNGSMLFPGGLLMQWGAQSSSQGAIISFPTAFSTSVFMVTASANTAGVARAAAARNITTAQFEVLISTAGAHVFQWYAIGV